MKFDTSDINSWQRFLGIVWPLLLPWLTGAVLILLQTETWRVALAGAISGFIGAVAAWLNRSPIASRKTTPAPVPGSPPMTAEEHPETDIPGPERGPGGPCALILVVAALLTPAIAEAAATTSSTASTRLEVTFNAAAASLHFDGSLGVGPAGCLGLRLSPVIYPIACLSLEVARAPSGDISGHLGPQLGVALPALETLGLKTTPFFAIGWGVLKIGPGDFFDAGKGAFQVSGSVPFLGL